MTNTMSDLWYKVGTHCTDVHAEKLEVFSNPLPHLFPLASSRSENCPRRGFLFDLRADIPYSMPIIIHHKTLNQPC